MAAWTPQELSPALWLDADDAATLTTTAGLVTQWRDKGPAARHATPAFANGPTLTTLGGRAAVLIGTDEALAFTDPGVRNGDFRAVFMAVGAGNAGDNNRGFFSLGVAGTTGARWALREISVNTLRIEINGSGFSGGSADAAGIVGAMHDGSAQMSGSTIWRNGVVTGSSASANAVVTGAASGFVGRISPSAASHYMGAVGEVILITGSLSVADRQRIEGYLAHRWGFAALLPAEHPYRSAPPESAAGGASLAGAAAAVGLTGQPASLRRGLRLAAERGAIALSGQAADLTIPDRRIIAAAGSCTLDGSSTALRAARRLPAAAGTLSPVGQAVTVAPARRIVAEAGSPELDGSSVALQAARRLLAAIGVLGFAGATVAFARTAPIPAQELIAGRWRDATEVAGRWWDAVAIAGRWQDRTVSGIWRRA